MKLTSRLLAVTLAITMAAVLVTPASTAQGTIKPNFALITASLDKTTLAPDLDVAKVTVTGKISYAQVGSVAGAVVIQSAIVQFSEPTCDKAGYNISGTTTVPVSQSSAGPTKQEFDFSAIFYLTASQDAPGETDIKCTFKAKAKSLQSNTYVDSDESTVTMLFKVKFLGLLTATIPQTIVEAGPQKEILYEIELTNLGNSLTNVNFQLASEVPEGWSPVPPTPIILQSQKQQGTEFTKKVNFLIQTPHSNGWNNDEKTFQLRITPSSTKDPTLVGNEIAVNVLARVRGIYVPGPEPFLLVGAVIGTALVARLMRREE